MADEAKPDVPLFELLSDLLQQVTPLRIPSSRSVVKLPPMWGWGWLVWRCAKPDDPEHRSICPDLKWRNGLALPIFFSGTLSVAVGAR
jgi:hypothetical protein